MEASHGIEREVGGSPRIQDLEIDGVSLHVSESGTGRPLLMIMGIGGHLGMWRPLEERLHPYGIRTITFDHPGTGDSSNYRRPRRLAGVVATIGMLLDQLGYEQVDVLGVSFGGGVAQQMAHQLPDRVRRLVLCATSPGMVSAPGTPRALTALITPRRYWDRDYYEGVAASIYGGRTRADKDPVEHASARFTHPPSAKGYANQLWAATGWTSFHWLHTLPQPTLVMSGDDDPIIPLVNAHLLAWRIPNADLHVVRGGGHLFLVDQVEDVLPPLTDFLSRGDD